MKLTSGAQMKVSSYRLRVFQLSDGSIDVVFNDGDLPTDPAAVVLIDHDVVDSQTWSLHVEPTPPPAPPTPAP